MSSLPVLAPILSSAVGLMGAMVAGLSVYFTYKGRHNLLRQVVYGRQMDAYFGITEAMTTLFTAAQSVLALRAPWMNGEDADEQFRTALRQEHEKFTATVNRSLIVLPSKVKSAVDRFNEALLAISAPDGAARPTDPTLDLDLAKAYEQAVNSIRYHLAVDSLTTGMLKEMGIGSESVTVKKVRPRLSPLAPVSVGRSHH